MQETTCNCCIDIVTIRKQPGRLVAKVRMTHATLLRSRMNGNVHVRFCSRVEVATPRLRQRSRHSGHHEHRTGSNMLPLTEGEGYAKMRKQPELDRRMW